MGNLNKPTALEGITVVELGTHVAVPNVSRAMADCGARVIKVENTKGEEWRMLGRNYGVPVSAEENAIFTNQNSNKEFIALDLKSVEGMKVLKELIAKADVFISNVRLKSLNKMGIGYDGLKDEFPRLVFCHFTGFGYDGPDSERPGFDMAAFWARSGAMVDWNNIGDFPLKPISGFGDAATGNLMLSGVLMALLARERTGKGTLVSSSLYGSAIWLNASGIVVTQDVYGNKYPKSRYAPVTPFSHIYECKDHNWIIITIPIYETIREKMFHLLGIEDLIDDPRYDTLAHVKEHIDEFTRIVNEKFMAKTRDEWAEVFQQNDVVYEKLVHYSEVADDPQASENNYIEEVTFKSGTKVKMPRLPLMFSEYETLHITPTGSVGCDSKNILGELGYSDTEIEAMQNNQTIVCGAK